MNLLDRLKLLVQSTVHGAVDDLFGEGESKPDRSAAPDTDKLLKQADQRLARLHNDLAQAVAREKRAEAAWQAANAKSRALNSEVDALLKADQTDAAREKLAQLKRADADVATLDKSLRQYAGLTTRLKQEMDELETHIKQVRERLQRVDEHEAHADLSEQRQQTQKAQTSATEQSTVELETCEEQVAQREDQIAAHDDVIDAGRMADIIKRLKK